MTTTDEMGLVEEAALNELTTLLMQDEERGMLHLDQLLEGYPRDARLYFLRGSFMAGQRQYTEAARDFYAAIEIDPGFSIARFQLGLLELSSGNAGQAEVVWQPLDALPLQAPLRLFRDGLLHLSQNRYAESIACLESGMALNDGNPAMNQDMNLVLERTRALMATTQAEPDKAESEADTHVLLSGYVSPGNTRH